MNFDSAVPGRDYLGAIVGADAEFVYQFDKLSKAGVKHARISILGFAWSDDACVGKDVKVRYPHGKVGLVEEVKPPPEKKGSPADGGSALVIGITG